MPYDLPSSEGPISVIDFQQEDVGKTIEWVKKKYTWRLRFDFKYEHEIVFTNTKHNGKKRIKVDGMLQHEQQVFKSSRFLYSWPLRNHLLSIMGDPKPEKPPYSPFMLTIDGDPFYMYLGDAHPIAMAVLRFRRVWQPPPPPEQISDDELPPEDNSPGEDLSEDEIQRRLNAYLDKTTPNHASPPTPTAAPLPQLPPPKLAAPAIQNAPPETRLARNSVGSTSLSAFSPDQSPASNPFVEKPLPIQNGRIGQTALPPTSAKHPALKGKGSQDDDSSSSSSSSSDDDERKGKKGKGKKAALMDGGKGQQKGPLPIQNQQMPALQNQPMRIPQNQTGGGNQSMGGGNQLMAGAQNQQQQNFPLAALQNQPMSSAAFGSNQQVSPYSSPPMGGPNQQPTLALPGVATVSAHPSSSSGFNQQPLPITNESKSPFALGNSDSKTALALDNDTKSPLALPYGGPQSAIVKAQPKGGESSSSSDSSSSDEGKGKGRQPGAGKPKKANQPALQQLQGDPNQPMAIQQHACQQHPNQQMAMQHQSNQPSPNHAAMQQMQQNHIVVQQQLNQPMQMKSPSNPFAAPLQNVGPPLPLPGYASSPPVQQYAASSPPLQQYGAAMPQQMQLQRQGMGNAATSPQFQMAAQPFGGMKTDVVNSKNSNETKNPFS